MSANIQPINLLSPGANLEAYIQAVNSIPILSIEQERDLGHRLFHESDLEAARALVMAHLRFVVHVARSYSGYGLQEADLIQEGNVGLMKAVKRYDPGYGVRLVSFAVHWIKAEIHEFVLKNWRIVKVATTKAQRKLFFNLRSSKTHLGWMNDREIGQMAEDLGVDQASVRQMESRLSGRDQCFDPNPMDTDEIFTPPPHLEDPDSDPAIKVEEEANHTASMDKLRKAVSCLDERSSDIIQQRWLVDRKLTLHQLAEKYGVSAERIRQLEQNALRKLRLSVKD